MRIVQMTSVHQWNDTRIFHKICKSLVVDGHEVHLIAPCADITKLQNIEGVTIHPISPPGGRWKRLINTTQLIFKLAMDIQGDIYHFHDFEFLRTVRDFQQSAGKPVIYDIHEDYRVRIKDRQLPASLRHIAGWGIGFFEDQVVKELAGIICATPRIAEHFSWHPCCEVVQNFPVIQEFSPIDNTIISDRELAFTYIGYISAWRGIKEIIKALSLTSPEIMLQLAGEWESQSLQKECSSLHGWRQVAENGFLGRQEIVRLLTRVRAGLVTLHPTRAYRDSYPVKMFEYMAAGIPVIASNFLLWREIVDRNKCGICVDPLKPQEIAKAVQWIADHPEEAKLMGENGRKAVEEKYNWECENKKLLKVYKGILEEG